jgi:hypothetical protein
MHLVPKSGPYVVCLRIEALGFLASRDALRAEYEERGHLGCNAALGSINISEQLRACIFRV